MSRHDHSPAAACRALFGPPVRRRFALHLALAAAIAPHAGCSGEEPQANLPPTAVADFPNRPRPPDTAAVDTIRAAEPPVRFTLAEPPDSLYGRALISLRLAGELAGAWLWTFGTLRNTSWNLGRKGDPIDLAALHQEPRIYYAESPYGAPPPGVHRISAKFHGPVFLVLFSQSGKRALWVAVSAFNTDVSIGPDWRVRLPRSSGGDFAAGGIPLGAGSVLGASPESAADAAIRAFGARVTAAPRLVLPRWGVSAGYAMWLLELDHPVQALDP